MDKFTVYLVIKYNTWNLTNRPDIPPFLLWIDLDLDIDMRYRRIYRSIYLYFAGRVIPHAEWIPLECPFRN